MVPKPIIPQATALLEPTPSQLDLTDFDVVYTRKGAFKVNSSRSYMQTPTASGAKIAVKTSKRKAFFARLSKSAFRIFALISRDPNAFKNERFWGIHPLQFLTRA